VHGWLIRVAHNIAMDKVRMRRSRPMEVAEDSGIPEGTAFSRSYYALRILRRELGIPSTGSQHQAA
jgi:DNA-directed RNA polymerase specialized sigma24 family protein